MDTKKPHVEPTLEKRETLMEVTEMGTTLSYTPPPAP